MQQEDLKQFSDLMDQKFEKNNKRFFEKIDILDKKIDNKINTLDNKIDTLDKKIDNKINTLDKKIDNKINTLDKKIDNKINTLDKKIDNKIDELALVTKQGFDEVENRLNNVENDMCIVKKDLKHVKDIQINIQERICDWNDNKLTELELDNNKIKYLHINEWKNLPSAYKIREVLDKNKI